MMKRDLLTYSTVIEPVFKADNSLIGSQARGLRRSQAKEVRAREFIEEASLISGSAASPLEADAEIEIRDLSDDMCKGNYSEKKEFLSHYGLSLDLKDEAGLRRQQRELISYHSTDVFRAQEQVLFDLESMLREMSNSRVRRGAVEISTEKALAELILLAISLCDISSVDLAFDLVKAMIFNAQRRRNQIVATLREQFQLTRGTVERDTCGLVIPNQLLLRIRNLRGSISERQYERMIRTEEFSNHVRYLLKDTRVHVCEDIRRMISEYACMAHTVASVYVSPHLREMYSGEPITSPISAISDWLNTTHRYPFSSSIDYTHSEEAAQFVDALFTYEGVDQLENDVFEDHVNTIFREVENSDCSGFAPKERNAVREKIEALTAFLATKYSLSWSQRYLLAFIWYMAAEGIPISLSKPSRGGLGSIKTYYFDARQFAYDLFDTVKADHISREELKDTVEIHTKGKYSSHDAGRAVYMLSCLQNLDILELPDDAYSIIHLEADNRTIPADAKVISKKGYDRAFSFAGVDEDGALFLRLALIAADVYGLRRSEIWNTRFDQIQISPSHICWEVGGRGGDKTKHTYSNRWVYPSRRFTYSELRVLAKFRRLRADSGRHRRDYVFQPRDAKLSIRGKNHFFRKVNFLLKRATGDEDAHIHLLRKTCLNRLCLAVQVLQPNSHRLEYLVSEKVHRSADLPSSILPGGCRAKFAAQFIANFGGHVDFYTAVRAYLVYGAELHNNMLSRSPIVRVINEHVEVVTHGEAVDDDGLASLLNCKRPNGFPGVEVKPKRPPKTPGNYRKSSVPTLETTHENVASVLLGTVPRGISTLGLLTGNNASILRQLRNNASLLADEVHYKHFIELPDRNERLKGIFPLVDLTMVSDSLDQLSRYFPTEADSDIYSINGLWRKSYRNLGGRGEAFVFESSKDAIDMIEHLGALGISGEGLKVKCGETSPLLNWSSDKSHIPVVLSPRKLKSLRTRSLRDPCAVSIGRSTSGGFQYMKALTFFGFVMTLTSELSQLGELP